MPNISEVTNMEAGKIVFVFEPEGAEVEHVLTRMDTTVLIYLSEDGDVVRAEVLFDDE